MEKYFNIEKKAYLMNAPILGTIRSSLKELRKLNFKNPKKKNVEAFLRFVTSEKQQFYKNLMNLDGILGSKL